MTREQSIVRVENSCVAENVEEQATDDISHDLHTSRPREPSDSVLGDRVGLQRRFLDVKHRSEHHP